MVTYRILMSFIILFDHEIFGQMTSSPDASCDNSYNALDNCYKQQIVEQQIKYLQSAVNTLQKQCSVCQNNSANTPDTSNCPTPGSAASIPAECCSFPFTLNGQLYYSCQTDPNTNILGCFVQGRKWVTCQNPSNFVAQNKTIILKIPNSNQQTVISVNNWIVFQQRFDSSTIFNLPWSNYKTGFGVYNGNFWMGLENIYQLTNSGQYRVRFEVLTQTGLWMSDEYDIFYLDNEAANYTIHINGVSGDGGSLMNITSIIGEILNGMPFTTYDRVNKHTSCATYYGGGWWFDGCFWINFNGIYDSMGFTVKEGSIRLSKSRMMIKKIT